MFLAYSRFELTENSNFDPKICEQHLQEVLKKVLVCYEETDEKMTDRRSHVEAVYLLFNLGDSKALERAIRLPRDANSNLSLRISLNYWQGNYYKALQLMRNLSGIECAIASIKLNEIRW